MKSTIWWLNLVVYISIPLLAFGLLLVGLSFTKIPKRTFRALRGNKKSNEGHTLTDSEYDADRDAIFALYKRMPKSYLKEKLEDIDLDLKEIKQLRYIDHYQAHKQNKKYLFAKDIDKYIESHYAVEMEYRQDIKYKQQLKTELTRLLNEPDHNIFITK